MADVYRELRFVRHGDELAMYYYPLSNEGEVVFLNKGDIVRIRHINSTVIEGRIVEFFDSGMILRSTTNSARLAISFSNIKDISIGRMFASDFDGDVFCVIPLDERKDICMPPERFKELLDELDGNSLQTLKEKNARYSTDGDCLHNFRSGAEVAGGTPAQACWGYMTKHLVALRDMVEKDDFSNREDFLEKCQDTINYIRFLWCIGNDASNSEKEDDTEEPLEEVVDDFIREIRIYSKRNGKLCAIVPSKDYAPYVDVYDDFFAVVVPDCIDTRTTRYSFDAYYCVILDYHDGKTNKRIIDKESK